MTDKSICRIGIFYDGSYFAYPQRYFYHKRNLGWLSFKPLHSLIEAYIRTKEQGYANYRIVYASWTQGMFTSSEADERQLRNDRNLQHDLMHAGIEIKYLPISTSNREKGVDVALAIDALQIGLEGKIDIAVLITGDADLVPLVQALRKQGIRVMAAHFEYEDGEDRSFISERLLSVVNYSLNINSLENDKDFKGGFKALFRKPYDFTEGKTGANTRPERHA
jgi:uncharacterized LabA/DUF88 family protein